jgi:hypothetical protein
MTLFRLFLVTCLIIITSYTMVTIANHGINFLPVFFAALAEMAWPGQFNLDFYCFLLLAGLWTAWRHHFSAGGIALGVAMTFLGFPLLSGYLLIASFKTNGDIKAMLLGEGRAKA